MICGRTRLGSRGVSALGEIQSHDARLRTEGRDLDKALPALPLWAPSSNLPPVMASARQIVLVGYARHA